MNRNLIFLSYGNENEYRRAIFSVLSFFSWYGTAESCVRVIIYTDAPSFFKLYLPGFRIEYFLLTLGFQEQMMGNAGFFHRMKVSVIDLTFKKFPNENVFFIDSDTFFISNPERLLNGPEKQVSFMHVREYRLSEAVERFSIFNQSQFPEAFMKYISDRDFMVGDSITRFGSNDYSWNSGVLGLHGGFSVYMPSVLDLTDQFYLNSKWFLSEQLAFSLVLDRTTEIKSCNDQVVHYWGIRQKLLLDNLIRNLLDEISVEELIHDLGFIRALTKEWARKIEIDMILDQAVISLSNGSYYYSVKKMIQLVWKGPKNLKLLYSELTKNKKGEGTG